VRRTLVLAGLIASLFAALATANASAQERPSRIPGRLHQPIAAQAIDQSLFNEAVLLYSNAARRAHGRPPLAADHGLAQAAADHARNMARLRSHSHDLPVRGQANLKQRMARQSVTYRLAAENIAMDKVYRLLGRPIAMSSRGCSFVYADTKTSVPIHSYASLAEQVVARWLASPRHRASLLSGKFQRLGSGVGIDPNGPACGDVYLVQDLAD
jgi:uncharacterized protein YkwD